MIWHLSGQGQIDCVTRTKPSPHADTTISQSRRRRGGRSPTITASHFPPTATGGTSHDAPIACEDRAEEDEAAEGIHPLWRCRSQPETLAHALNHCRGYMGLIWSRHGEILKRIRKAIPAELGEVYLEQEISGDPEKNRPDLVIINRTAEKVIVVDVTIPFEGEKDSLQKARATKETKYSRLKSWLQTQYKEVEVFAFVVGALGSWDLDNEPVLQMLRIRRNYSRL